MQNWTNLPGRSEKPFAGSVVYSNPAFWSICASMLRVLQKKCILAAGASAAIFSATATAG
jgi:hypothetical protein